jgi:hypothetical protein
MMNPDPVLGQGVLRPPPERAPVGVPETNIVPMLTIAERYDSNVFFVRGHNFEDYVTTVSPQLRVAHRRPLFEATVGGGVTAERYVKNPGISYVAANGLLDLNLDGLMGQLVSGLGLHITDLFRFTPQPTAFGTPAAGTAVSDAFARGIQAQRANSFSNGAKVEGSYAISPLVSFNSTYGDSRIRFGSAAPVPGSTTPTGEFIDTTFQTVNSGPVIKVSPLDTVSISHQYQKGSFSFPTGQHSSFSTQGGILGWTRLITPTLTGELTAGAVVFDASNRLEYLGSASLVWKYRDTDASLSYSRAIRPSFFIAGTPLLSQRVTGTVTHHVTEPLSVSMNANYSLNESIPDSSLLQFESYSVTPSVEYQINRILTARLSYTHSMFTTKQTGVGSTFDRNIVLLRLVAEWK